jgi:putative acetyltransferase
MVTIIPYEKKYHQEFRRLNMEWLEKYNLMESHDLEILDDPDGTVLSRGGCIFLAMDNEKVVGTAGLWKENDNEYELVKMAVDPEYRGRGIGKNLMDYCISEARQRNAKRVFLFSNSQLKTALQLYSNYGFRHIEATDSPFVTADVKMELVF